MGAMDRRRALITGGSNGLGRATAELFASEGADVAIADLQSTEPQAIEAVEAITSMGRKAIFVPMDVTDIDQVNDGVDRAHEALGGLDALVASAGVAGHQDNKEGHRALLRLDPAHFDFVMDVNLRGCTSSVNV